MGASESSMGKDASGLIEVGTPESSESYIPGTNLPVDGWMQPCSDCTTTTARCVPMPGGGTRFICRRCDTPNLQRREPVKAEAEVEVAEVCCVDSAPLLVLPVLPAQRGSFESSRQRGMSAEWLGDLQLGNANGAQQGDGTGAGLERADWDDDTLKVAPGGIGREGELAPVEALEVGLTLPAARCRRHSGEAAPAETASPMEAAPVQVMAVEALSAEVESPSVQSHQKVDLLCHAVVGEMLMGEGSLASVWGLAQREAAMVAEHEDLGVKTHRRQDSGVSSVDLSSPNGVCDAAEVWSDLDSPRRLSAANLKDKDMARSCLNSAAPQQAKGGAAAEAVPSPGASAWALSHTDSTLYPHDFWHWNMHSAGTALYV